MSAAEFEGTGQAVAMRCLDTIANANDQATACRAVLKMLNALSGDGKKAKGARRGASVAL